MTTVPLSPSDDRSIATGLVAVTKLPVADLGAELPRAPRDQWVQDVPLPQRLHPLAPITVHSAPEGAPIAILPTRLLQVESLWLPMIAAERGWAMVLLPCRPDGVAGWIRLDEQVAVDYHPVHIEVDTRTHTIELVNDGHRSRWSAGVGKPSSPTPRGRTFVVGSVECDRGLVDRALLLAAHATTHLTYQAGLTAVGIHTWPGTSMLGRAGGDGSVIVPVEAMATLEAWAAPGTPVLIR